MTTWLFEMDSFEMNYIMDLLRGQIETCDSKTAKTVLKKMADQVVQQSDTKKVG